MVPTRWREQRGMAPARKGKRKKEKEKAESLRKKDGSVGWSKAEGEPKVAPASLCPEACQQASKPVSIRCLPLQAKLQDKQTGLSHTSSRDPSNRASALGPEA